MHGGGRQGRYAAGVVGDRGGWRRRGPSSAGDGGYGRRPPSAAAARDRRGPAAAPRRGSSGDGPMFWKPGADTPQTLLRSTEKESNVAVYNPRSRLALSKQRRMLPIFQRRRELLYAVDKYQTVILVGETGCGKSTQMPQYLDEAGWTVGGRVVGCTQPRQVAAATVAARVADEMGSRLGDKVGFAVRFESRVMPGRTRVKYMTDGVLIRETMMDPLLSQYSVIMVDEAHERSLETDVLLGLLKKIRRKRPDLRIIIASATMDAKKFRKFFETNKTKDRAQDTACIVSVQGRQHDVDILYSVDPVADYVKATVKTVLAIHAQEGEGDVLAFLPGQQEIEAACRLIRESVPTRGGRPIEVMPLYANLPFRMQLAAMAPLPRPKARGMLQARKVVIATNIAETSVTIDGIVFVVDSGFAKLPVYNPKTGMDTLIVQPISQDSANQRAGRAGRVRHGKCFRLYPEAAFLKLSRATPPEMIRTDLTAVVLQLKALGIDDVAHFDFMDSPPAESLIRALELLFALGALDGTCKLTAPLGQHLAEFPIEPRVAAMLMASLRMGCSEEALTIAAMTSVKSIFAGGLENRRKSDLALREYAVAEGDQLTLINVYNAFLDEGKNAAWCRDRGFKYRALVRASEVRRQLRRYLVKLAQHAESATVVTDDDAIPGLADLTLLKSAGDDVETILKCVVAGFFSNAAKMNADGSYRTVKDGRRVVLHPTSVLFRYSQLAPWVVYHDVQLTTEEHMREVIAIKPTWLTELAPQYYETRDTRRQGAQSSKRSARQAMLPPRSTGILGLLAAEQAPAKPKRRRTVF